MFLYLLLTNKDRYYCGITSDLDRREARHNAGTGSKMVKMDGGGKIVAAWWFAEPWRARAAEVGVKRLKRKDKIDLLSPSRTTLSGGVRVR